jgi:hypothetical protein
MGAEIAPLAAQAESGDTHVTLRLGAGWSEGPLAWSDGR